MSPSRAQLKQFFETRDKPTEGQFAELIDSMRHVDDKVAVEDIDGLQEILAGKASTASIDGLNNRLTALEGKKVGGYFLIASGDTGLSVDDNGRLTYQNNLLKGKSGYLIEAQQLGSKLSPLNNVDVKYNPTAGSFTVLVPNFALTPGCRIIVWLNFNWSDAASPAEPTEPGDAVRYKTVATYADMISYGQPTSMTVFKISLDEISGQAKAIYQWWPDGDLILTTGSYTAPGTDPVTYMLPDYVQLNYVI